MTNGRASGGPGVHEIRVRETLDHKWADWFDRLAIAPQPDDETLLAGPVAHQAALHGLLAKIRDLGLPLLSVKWVENASRNLSEEARDEIQGPSL